MDREDQRIRPDIDKAAVYRKAAEIIVRDGKCEGDLTPEGDDDDALRNPALPVCALGACARAEYELYGTVPWERPYGDPWRDYGFKVSGEPARWIQNVNDTEGVSAEDVALLLKKRAEEIDSG